jgi:hypothetical protein
MNKNILKDSEIIINENQEQESDINSAEVSMGIICYRAPRIVILAPSRPQN